MSGPAVDVGTVAKAATGMAEALTTALTAFLKDRKAELANAVRDPAQGITITFTFTAPDRAALLQPGLPTPAIVVKLGWRHG